MRKFLATLPLVAAMACSQMTAPTSVAIAGFLFTPDSIQVDAGTEVTWRNDDEILHTITAGEPGAVDDTFFGETPEAGISFTFGFDQPGEYKYFCSRHEHMRGTVTVR